jgi:hypothetical protein
MLEVALAAVPLLLLLASLLAGFYPGCEAAVRLAERFAAGSAPEAANRQPAPRRRHRSAAHGGLLLALSLSGRSPPAAA